MGGWEDIAEMIVRLESKPKKLPEPPIPPNCANLKLECRNYGPKQFLLTVSNLKIINPKIAESFPDLIPDIIMPERPNKFSLVGSGGFTKVEEKVGEWVAKSCGKTEIKIDVIGKDIDVPSNIYDAEPAEKVNVS